MDFFCFSLESVTMGTFSSVWKSTFCWNFRMISLIILQLSNKWVRGDWVVRCRTLRSRGCGFESHQRLLCTNANSARHPSGGQLMSTSESWGVNGHAKRCTSPVSVVLQLRLVSGWGLMKRRSALPHGPYGSVKDFTFTFKQQIDCPVINKRLHICLSWLLESVILWTFKMLWCLMKFLRYLTIHQLFSRYCRVNSFRDCAENWRHRYPGSVT